MKTKRSKGLDRRSSRGRRATPPWSRFKKEIESLFAENLDLVLHCTYYQSGHIPRHHFVLNKEVIWDYPGVFMDENPGIPLYQAYWRGYHTGQTTPADLLRAWLDLPRDQLMEPMPEDPCGLSDILRAADRRLGKERLLEWGKTLHEYHPARKVLEARFG